MNDKETELLIKQSRTIVLLSVIILFLICIVFLVTYCKPTLKPDNEKKEEFYCGNATVPDILSYNVTVNGDRNKGSKLFKQNCAVCHSAFTDMMLTGPGLLGVLDRIPKPAEEWFIKYSLNNKKVYLSGDAYAKKLKREHKNGMTVFEDYLTEQDIKDILLFISNSSAIASH